MSTKGVVTQIRTTNLEESIDFYVSKLGLELGFRHEDFYAGIKVGDQQFHLKQVDEPEPSINYVSSGDHFHLYLTTDDIEDKEKELKSKGVTFIKEIDDTNWKTREFVILDNQGHTIYFGQAI